MLLFLCLVDVIIKYFRDAHLLEGGEFVTLEDAKGRYGLSMEKLQGYAEQGLLRCRVKPDGSVDYEEDDFKKIGQIQSLTAIGMSLENLRLYFSLSENNAQGREGKNRMLRKCRAGLLEEIHEKQQILDRIDYYICELKKQGGREVENETLYEP